MNVSVVEMNLLPFGLAFALASLPVSGSAQPQHELATIRRLWMSGAESSDSLETALRLIESMDESMRSEPRVMAFEGALMSMRGKHSSWPHRKVLHVRRGLRLLDAAVAADPSDPEVRYLRMLTCDHLPGLFRRSWAVEVDADSLAGSIGELRSVLPSDFYSFLVRFVMEHATLAPGEAKRREHELLNDL